MNLLNIESRIKVIETIRSEANNARKQWSWRAGEVQQGRCHQFVKEQLEGMFNVDSVREMPIINSINIQKRIVERKATIYKEAPERKFTNLDNGENTDRSETMKMIYKDACINQKLNRSNKDFIYQDQSIGMIYPCKKDLKLKARIFKMHQIDAIPSMLDPESSDGFIISVFDREHYQQLYQDKKERDTATGNQGRSVRSSASPIDGDSELSNEYQYKKYVEQYLIWTPELNFMMNGHGEVLDMQTGEVDSSIDITSPFIDFNFMPFFEVSREKDFEYFVRSGYPLTDFTVEFNRALSDLQNNIKMNGYSVAVLKAPSELQPQSQVVGAAMLLKLPTDDPEKEIDFSFASPQSSIGEISSANDQMLNYFVSSMGEDRGAINSNGEGEKSASGIDRFIKMVDRLHASKDDYETYRDAESQIYKIIKAWLEVLSGTDQLDRKYWINNIPETSEVIVNFHRPEMIQTESEKVDIQIKRRELGTASRVDFLMSDKGMSREDAIKEALRIDTEELMGGFNGQTIRQEQDNQV